MSKVEKHREKVYFTSSNNSFYIVSYIGTGRVHCKFGIIHFCLSFSFMYIYLLRCGMSGRSPSLTANVLACPCGWKRKVT